LLTSVINEQAEADMQWLQGLIGAVRNIRGEMGLGNARLLPVLTSKHDGCGKSSNRSY
jgi:Valyl-tRNA synthetase